jgi:hypothetical protein
MVSRRKPRMREIRVMLPTAAKAFNKFMGFAGKLKAAMV